MLVLLMPRFKVLKSVAHNIGHSFTSLMNYAGDDYVMGHILQFARRSGKETLTIDLVTGEAEPIELLAEPVSDVPSRYSKFFWYLVQTHGSDRSFVQAPPLTSIRCIQRPTRGCEFTESPTLQKYASWLRQRIAFLFERWCYPKRLCSWISGAAVVEKLGWIQWTD
jgi:hypothetical protein